MYKRQALVLVLFRHMFPPHESAFTSVSIFSSIASRYASLSSGPVTTGSSVQTAVSYTHLAFSAALRAYPGFVRVTHKKLPYPLILAETAADGRDLQACLLYTSHIVSIRG